MKEKTGVLNKAGLVLDRISRVFSQLSVFVMVVVVLLNVFMRYFVKDPLVWGDELAKYSLVYMTFIGASVALRDRGIAAMELVVEKFPMNGRKTISIIVCILEIILLAFLFYNSVQLLLQDSVKNQISPGLLIPMTWVYFSMPLGIGLMVIQATLLLIEEIIGFKNIKGGIEK